MLYPSHQTRTLTHDIRTCRQYVVCHRLWTRFRHRFTAFAQSASEGGLQRVSHEHAAASASDPGSLGPGKQANQQDEQEELRKQEELKKLEELKKKKNGNKDDETDNTELKES